jgi:hypothetical protein
MRVLLVILAILPSVTGYSQTNIVTFFGVNFPTFPLRESSFYLEHYWKDGVNIGVSAELKVRKSILLSPGVEYSFDPFDLYDGPIDAGFEPEMFIKSVDGENSNVYRFLLEVKWFPKRPAKEKSQPFLSSGFGYVIEDIGKIHVLWGAINGPDFLDHNEFKSKSYFIHSAGIGLRWCVTRNVKLNVEGKYFTDYRSRFQNSWNVGILFMM